MNTPETHYSRSQRKAFRAFEAAIENYRQAEAAVTSGSVTGEISTETKQAVWEASVAMTSERLLLLIKPSEMAVIRLCVPEREKLIHEIRTQQ